MDKQSFSKFTCSCFFTCCNSVLRRQILTINKLHLTIIQVVGRMRLYAKQLIKICKIVNPIASILEADFVQTLQGKKQASNRNCMKLFFKAKQQMYRKSLTNRLPEKCVCCIPAANNCSGFYEQSSISSIFPILLLDKSGSIFFLIIYFQGQSVKILGTRNIFWKLRYPLHMNQFSMQASNFFP